jgi:hypothetical protein
MTEDEIKSVIQFTIKELGSELSSLKEPSASDAIADAIADLGRNDSVIGEIGNGLHRIGHALERIAGLYNSELGYKLDGDIK